MVKKNRGVPLLVKGASNSSKGRPRSYNPRVSTTQPIKGYAGKFVRSRGSGRGK